MLPPSHLQKLHVAQGMIAAASTPILQLAHSFLIENNRGAASTCSLQIATLGQQLIQLFGRELIGAEASLKEFYYVSFFPSVIAPLTLMILEEKIQILRNQGVNEEIELPEPGTLENQLAIYRVQKSLIASENNKTALNLLKEHISTTFGAPAGLLNVEKREWRNRNIEVEDLGTFLKLISTELFHENTYRFLIPAPVLGINPNWDQFGEEDVVMDDRELEFNTGVSAYLQRQYNQLQNDLHFA